MRSPRVELLWWEGCPSTGEALELLRAEVGAVGLDPEAIVVREVASESDAEDERFVGSPTIRIDGRDLQPVPQEPVGLSCRVYRLADGRVSPLPDRSEVRQTLREAMTGGDD